MFNPIQTSPYMPAAASKIFAIAFGCSFVTVSFPIFFVTMFPSISASSVSCPSTTVHWLAMLRAPMGGLAFTREVSPAVVLVRVSV
jgi:hypothetical protein